MSNIINPLQQYFDPLQQYLYPLVDLPLHHCNNKFISIWGYAWQQKMKAISVGEQWQRHEQTQSAPRKGLTLQQNTLMLPATMTQNVK